MLVVLLANVCVSLTLAFGPGPLPAFGFLGVCWGTFTARTVGCALALAAVFARRRSIAVRGADLLAWDAAHLGPLARLTLPTAGERLANAAGHAVFISVVSRLGTETLAAHMIAVNIEALCFMPAVGLGVAVTTMVGQAVGAGRAALGRLALGRALCWSLAGMLSLGVLFVLFAPWIVRLYGSSPEVLRQAAVALRIAALEIPCLAAAIVLAAACRGAGDAASPMWVTFAALPVFRFGVVYLLAVSLGWGIAGVWLSTAADWAARAAAMGWLFRRRMAKLASLPAVA
jgi:putative MATE family efflux protein